MTGMKETFETFMAKTCLDSTVQHTPFDKQVILIALPFKLLHSIYSF